MQRIVRVKVLVVAIVCILAYLTFNMAADAINLKGNIRTVATYVFIGGGLLYLFVTGQHCEPQDRDDDMVMAESMQTTCGD